MKKTQFNKSEFITDFPAATSADRIQSDFSDILFQNHELNQTHNPYDQEVREMSGIRSGDEARLRRSWAESYHGRIGTLAKTPLRQNKNHGIVLVTLASRAAIEGGLLPEIAFSLSDSYICRIEETTDPMEAFQLGREAELQYTQMVHALNTQKKDTSTGSKKNPHIYRCKDYIFTHLHEKLYVSTIAAMIGLNANYLSELFHTCEGISLSEFILQEKITRAKNLLIYSEYRNIEIAAYLGFSSQSHFGVQFRKATGKSPGQYRKEYGKKYFY